MLGHGNFLMEKPDKPVQMCRYSLSFLICSSYIYCWKYLGTQYLVVGT